MQAGFFVGNFTQATYMQHITRRHYSMFNRT